VIAEPPFFAGAPNPTTTLPTPAVTPFTDGAPGTDAANADGAPAAERPDNPTTSAHNIAT
jgi:hypothetical protein